MKDPAIQAELVKTLKNKMEKKLYEKIKEIKYRISKKEKTTFAERNIINIIVKKNA